MKKIIKFKKWEDPIYTKEEYGEESEHPPMILTPHGLVSLKLHSTLKNNLKFYVGHTNFDIGENEKSIIENTPGINMLDIFSAYTFKFQIGLCFNIHNVMKDLRDRLCDKEELNLKQKDKITISTKEIELKETGDPYVIYVLPNGRFESFHSSSKKEYVNIVKKYLTALENFGGEIIYGGV